MRYLLLFLLLIGGAITSSAQQGTLRGRVIDSESLAPLPFANVYFNYTSKGTSTNTEGEFVINNDAGVHELVVSFVGYKTYQVKIKITADETKHLVIKLSTAVLSEIQVVAKRDKQWDQQLDKFKRMFLGNSGNTSQCTIVNPWVLDFKEDKGIFIARATTPLYIENMGMGYNIFYQLSNFSIGPTHFSISGTVRFQEMQSSDTSVQSLWVKKREEFYSGSSRHFFKSILAQKTNEEGFNTYEDISGSPDVDRNSSFLVNINKSIIHYNEFKVEKDSTNNEYTIRFPSRLEIHYTKKSALAKIYRTVSHPISWIEVKNGFLKVNANGIVTTPANLTLLGAWSESRIADMLPNDYQPTSVESKALPIVNTKGRAWKTLVEKPYLHTDKSYYYPSETIRFKGYMNYIAPAIKDSLSKVIYIDLIDASQKIVATKVFPIIDSEVIGSLSLPVNLSNGDYQLRAYTRWGLNFGSSTVFSKSIKLLNLNEAVRATSNYIPAATSKELHIITDRNDYFTRDKVILSLEVSDFYGYPEVAHLSISVTDMEQVVPVAEEKTINTEYPIPEATLPDTSVLKFSIQKGIDLKGQFITTRKKKAQGKLTFMQENPTDIFVINTKKDGSFFIPNVLLYDSSKVLVHPTTLKGNNEGIIQFDTTKSTPAITRTEPLTLSVYKSESVLRSPLYNEVELPARVLDEVTVKDSRLDTHTVPTPYVTPDFRITGEWLRNSNTPDILLSLQAKIPGLRVIILKDSNGLLRKYLSFGAFSLGTSSFSEVLLVIDGMVVNQTNEDQTAAEKISFMNSNEVDHIDVLKYGSGAAFGARGGNGVISISTRKGGTPVKPDSFDKSKLQPVKGDRFSAYLAPEFPDYDQLSDSTTGDYRSVIYWNPDVRTNKDSSTSLIFFTADLPSAYRIVVEGVTQSGKAIRGEKIITVVKRD